MKQWEIKHKLDWEARWRKVTSSPIVNLDGVNFSTWKCVFSTLHPTNNICLEKHYNRCSAEVMKCCGPLTEAAELISSLILSNAERHISFGCWSVDCQSRSQWKVIQMSPVGSNRIDRCEKYQESILNLAKLQSLLITGSMSINNYWK